MQSLADLKGKSFAFGSVSSTSGSLMPRYFMLQDGIKPESHFQPRRLFRCTRRHRRLGAGRQGGCWGAQCQCVGQAGRQRHHRQQQGTGLCHYPDLLRLQLDRAWHPRPGADREDQGRLPGLDPAIAEHKAVLDLRAASRFIETAPENYQGIEEAARAADLLK